MLCGSSSLAAPATHDLQAELDKALALARAGEDAAAFAIWKSLAKRGEPAKWKTAAARRGYASALYNLGVVLTEGRGVPRDENQAAEYFRKAAIQGHAKAQYNLGILYQTGRGVPKDPQRARYWLDRAKANGVVEPNGAAQVKPGAEKAVPERGLK